MYISDFYIALVIGLVLSLLVAEIFGVIPGGMVVPGYLAMICDTPATLVLTLLISFVAFGIIKYVMPKFVVLYGRKRFVALIILSVLIKLAFDFVFPVIPFVTFEMRGIGVIVPALIANCFFRQGIKFTLASVLATTFGTFGALYLVLSFA
ncbi:MAG: poly-gamma-glutamate biosynthesis protein PgsC [Firmicutes bacterium]|nr:poly-gamma-glutamate biosynthesis protein PgsC [Bacillota bacterium]